VLLAVLAGASREATTAATASAPRTLVTAHGRIYAFAQDGDWIGWVAGDARVRVRRLSTRRTWVVGKVGRPERASTAVIALARSRALWAWDSSGNNVEETIVSGAPGTKAAGVDLLLGDLRGTGGGARFSGVAGDGATLAYGWVLEQCVNRPLKICDVPWTDPLVVTGGGVVLARAGQHPLQRPPVIPGVPPPAMFAIGEGRVAVVPARSPTPPGEWVPRVAEDGPVDVYNLAGNRLMSARFDGLVRGVALAGHTLALLQEQPNGSKVIRRFDARNGAYVAVSGRIALGATDLSASTGGIVFRVGLAIYVLHGRTPRFVVRATGTPVGLSIEGRRVAWAENVHGHGRILAVTVPR